tara:strand:+ start:201 stop:377 length:177 start_codon:yes stop_codon:yes gene_type:complete
MKMMMSKLGHFRQRLWMRIVDRSIYPVEAKHGDETRDGRLEHLFDRMKERFSSFSVGR